MIVQEPLDFVVDVEERELPQRHRKAIPVAQCATLLIGFAAYDAAVERFPKDLVRLRHGIRTVRVSHREDSADIPGS